MTQYPINEMFLSLQGEGQRAGTANVFVRFAGCNQTCRIETHGFDCDTEFTSRRMMSASDIMAEAQRLWQAESRPNIILTGGEPLLHVDDELTALLLAQGGTIALETNGSLPMPAALMSALEYKQDVFVSCSPKVAEHALRLQAASELRYVRSGGQGIPKPRLKARHLYLSPAWERGGFEPEALDTCRRLILENPSWALSVQQHKIWSVR